jgi:hypothetical protein
MLLCDFVNLIEKEGRKMDSKKGGSGGKVAVMIAVILCIVLCFASCGGSSSSSSSSSTHINTRVCTICGKTATHTFQGYGYCTKHYNKALNTMANKYS